MWARLPQNWTGSSLAWSSVLLPIMCPSWIWPATWRKVAWKIKLKKRELAKNTPKLGQASKTNNKYLFMVWELVGGPPPKKKPGTYFILCSSEILDRKKGQKGCDWACWHHIYMREIERSIFWLRYWGGCTRRRVFTSWVRQKLIFPFKTLIMLETSVSNLVNGRCF